MVRPIWTGSIAFGLVHVPVELFAATREHQPRFHRLDNKTKRRIHHKRVTSGSDEAVDYADTVKGYEVAKGRHVVISDAEIKAALPEQHRRIDIEQFVDVGEIDPMTWRKAYYVAPPKAGKADRPYVLLRRALQDTGLVGIARLVMRSREYLVTIRPLERVLVLHTMFFADEIIDAKTLGRAPTDQRVPAKELELATKLIQSLAAPFEHRKFHDRYQQRVLALVKKKAKGAEIAAGPEEVEAGAEVIDLMAALKQSLAAKRTRPKAGPRKADGRRRRKAS